MPQDCNKTGVAHRYFKDLDSCSSYNAALWYTGLNLQIEQISLPLFSQGPGRCEQNAGQQDPSEVEKNPVTQSKVIAPALNVVTEEQQPTMFLVAAVCVTHPKLFSLVQNP